ncbi:excisionase [Mixta theicola]|uniref:excisionase n=1 Tax=Mixta theicola TaxID=1458355 RepID=UPI001F0B9F57|nr:excisionase [Mixta theicola]
MAKLLNLLEWANETYSKPPSLSTLRRWVREGRTYPCRNCMARSTNLNLARFT